MGLKVRLDTQKDSIEAGRTKLDESTRSQGRTAGSASGYLSNNQKMTISQSKLGGMRFESKRQTICSY